MQAYPKYKVVNGRWFDSLPSTWDVLRAKWIFSNEKERSSEEDEQLAASQKYGVVPQKLMIELNNANVMLALKGTDNFKKIKKNDFVISLRSFEGGIEYSDYNGCISPAYTVLRLREKWVEATYFKYALKCQPFIQALNSTSEGIRDGKTITYDEFGELLLALPPEEDQKTIANFLDQETARIDNLISEKQTFIKLLKEKRQALISHVVTKGLDPNVKMKDSGIEWIGDVPEGWECGKIKHIAKISNGATPNRDTTEFWESGTIGWLNSSKVNDVYIESADQFITEYAVKKTSVQSVKPNDLVMAITGEGQTRGRVAICKTDATINQHLAAISVINNNVNVEYLFYWLTSQYTRIRYESSGAGSTKGAITCTDIGLYPLPIPTMKEQKLIVESIKAQLKKYDGILNETEKSVQFLQEHRTALISAAVTGKIDVRNYKQATEMMDQIPIKEQCA